VKKATQAKSKQATKSRYESMATDQEVSGFWDNYFDRHEGKVVSLTCPVCENEEKSQRRKSCSVCGEQLT
jgi:hypothetical protein